MANYKQEIENYLGYWNTIYGIVVAEIIFLSVYFNGIKEVLKETFIQTPNYILNILIPFLICSLIFLFWAFKSHRFGLFKKRKITIGLFFKCDDYDKTLKIKKIVND